MGTNISSATTTNKRGLPINPATEESIVDISNGIQGLQYNNQEIIDNLQNIDSQTNKLHFDYVENALVNIPEDHHKIHESEHFMSSYVNTDVDTASRDILIVTTTKEVHLIHNVNVSAGSRFFLFENTTRTGGTAVASVSKNRQVVGTSTVTVTHTPGAGVDGTTLEDIFFGATGNASVRQPGSGRGENEWLLSKNKSYLIRVTTLQDNTSVSINLDWYEV